ncbi:MAG: DUF2812 domain-containing protein [Lachnospiraceae bacterium]|nr:DUF2812 domain-containing protein [Lachnospiraceae bacterium]
MAVQRSFLAAFKHIVPADLEFYLEEKNAEGLILVPLKGTSVFSLLFTEEAPKRYKYAVDCPTIPKAMYMKKLSDDGWEYLGQSMNRYLWRKEYEEGERPGDFSDKLGQYRHCLQLGLILLVLALVFVGLFGALCYTLYREYSLGGMDPKRFAAYLVVIAFQLPFVFLFFGGSVKLLKELPVLKGKMDYQRAVRKV